MKRIIPIALLSLGMMLPGHSSASDFEAALTSETAQFTFRSDSSLIGWGGSELGVGLFYNDADDLIGQFTLMQRRQASEEAPLTLGVGVRGYLGVIDRPNQDVFSVAIGGEVRYTIPGTMPMAVYLNGFYAPKITSFADVEEVTDINLGYQIEILPQTTAFAGFRNFKVDLDNNRGGVELDDDHLHIGVRLTF